MARRKKTTKTAKKTVTQTVTPTSVGYSGKINVKVTNRGKTVYNNTFHNNGGTKLFKFLCECLAGQYGAAETQRPMKIRLFNTAYSWDDIKAKMTNHENLVDTKSTALTDMIFYNTSATTGEVANTEYADNTRNYKVVFHFLVSYAQLNTTASEINQIAIYGKNETVNDNYCAVFYFLNDDGTALAPISTSGWDSNYVLQLEWTMTLTNGQEASN